MSHRIAIMAEARLVSFAEAKRERLSVGGGVAPDQLYIERETDQALAEHIRRGTWVNLVGARTMGKSSTFYRVARSLRQEGFICLDSDISLNTSMDENARMNEDPFTAMEGIARGWAYDLDRDWKVGINPEAIQRTASRIHRNHPADDAEKLWLLLQFLLERTERTHRALGKPWQRMVLGIDEVQFMSMLGYGERFVRAMAEIPEKLRQSKWNDRLVMCFIGWQALGAFLEKTKAIPTIATTVEMKDWPIDDQTVNCLSRIFADSGAAREAVWKILQLTGGQPFVTCAALEEVREDVEVISHDETRSYGKAAEDLEGRNARDFESKLRVFIRHTQHSLRNAPDKDDVRSCLQHLLAAPDMRCDARPGMETLWSIGVVRRVGEKQFEIKSRLFAEWFRPERMS